MCGRARLPNDYSEIKIQLRLSDAAAAPNFRASWNIPPTGDMLVATRSEKGERVSEVMRWGLIPSWSKDGKVGATHNARAETVDTKPIFRAAWRAGRRCLVILDGFYEWRKSDRQSFAVGMANKKLMTTAGLWEEWISPAGERIKTCTIITTMPNDKMARIHDRMPVILAEGDWPRWLGEVPASDAELKALLVPCPSDAIEVWPVDPRVGNVRNDSPELVKRVHPKDRQGDFFIT